MDEAKIHEIRELPQKAQKVQKGGSGGFITSTPSGNFVPYVAISPENQVRRKLQNELFDFDYWTPKVYQEGVMMVRGS